MANTRGAELRLSVVVPVYRSERILPRLVEEVRDAAAAAGCAGDFELILVNDASPDDSWSVIERLVRQHSFVKGICLARNFGQHNATMAGLKHAAGAVVVIMDDDLQHPPSAIGELLTTVESGFDVCYTKYAHRKHSRWKTWGSRFNDLVANVLLSKPKGLYLSSFKAMNRIIVDEVVRYDGPFVYLDGLILETTQRISTITIEHQERFEGKGNYGFKRSVSLWLKMATNFSVVPLRVATASGMVIALSSVAAILLTIVDKILHPEMSAGWASMVSIVLFMGGVQLLCLGVIGEYVGRAYLKLNCKPQFVVRKLVGGDSQWEATERPRMSMPGRR